MELTIKIKDPILRSYLNGLFPQQPGGGYLASTVSCTGAVICSLAVASNYPHPREQDTKDAVTFHIPKTHYNNNLRGKYIYLDKHAQEKVNVVLRREFETNFISYCTNSRIQGIKVKDAIAMFIIENQMDIFDGDIETLKKRHYRSELLAMKNMHEKLRQKFYLTSRRSSAKTKMPSND